MTLVQVIKGGCLENKNRDKADDDLISLVRSRIKQAADSLFNWLIQKTDIQRASKARD